MADPLTVERWHDDDRSQMNLPSRPSLLLPLASKVNFLLLCKFPSPHTFLVLCLES